MSTTQTTRLLLVGAGRMGQVHLRASARVDDVVFVAVADPFLSEDSADDPLWSGLELFPDIDAALAARQFDAALIATPSDLHVEVVSQLVGVGIPVLCEKPLGLTPADARAAGDAARAAGVPLQIGYWRRFVPDLVALKQRITDGELGVVTLAQAWQWDGDPPSAAFRRRSGGIVRDMGVHEIDMIRWLTGEAIEVSSAVASTVVTTDEVVESDPESVALLARLAGGGVGFVSLGRRYRDGDSCWLEVIGSKDAARVDYMRGAAGDEVFLDAIAAQLGAFGELVRGADQRGATAEDAEQALSALEAADRLLNTEEAR
jgi:myo-inositol 2-dehydrogenase/D-chiro-inositol 1-dehydrogenase